jgi:hypothetical protein
VSSGARTPTASEISAALAALGVYAAQPSEHELEEQAEQAGGEDVLAAALANALYRAAIGAGMLTEGRMQERRGQNNADLTLARRQALMASGPEGPGFAGAMHWRASHIAWPLRALKDHEIAAARPGGSRSFLGTRVAPSVDVPRRARRHARRGGDRLSGDSKD